MYIIVRRKNGSRFKIEFDREDKGIVSSNKWYVLPAYGKYYASTYQKGRSVFLHRIIMNPGPKLEVDHIDGNGLNNRRSNLRVVSHAANLHNGKLRAKRSSVHSDHKGVCWRESRKRWRAYVYFNGKYIEIGTYKDEATAIRRQEEVEHQLFGFVSRRTATGRLSSGEEE
jgi:hypothetical protein